MATRSSRLWVTRMVGRPSTTVYTVPAGETVILKSIELANQGVSPSDVLVLVSDQVDSAAVILHSGTLASAGAVHWTGWVVLEVGDRVILSSTASAIDSWGSGAVLPSDL